MSVELIGRVAAGENLALDEIADAIDQIMNGDWPEEQIGLLLTALHHKGETVEEVAGAAVAMRRHMTQIHSDQPNLLDTCGTGGDGSGTFNISTAAAIVTAATGIPVAKHGNRSITSKTGSADVLAQLGVNIEATVGQAEACLAEVGICFCFAPLLHQSMKNVATVRRSLGFPTIFNLLGPLCNPANAPFQLLGVGKPTLRPLMSQALQRLGTTRAVVVCGEDGLDEVTLNGPTRCTEVGTTNTREFAWTPSDFGIASTDDFSSMEVDGPEASARVIRDVLDDKPGPARDIVVLNSAAAIWTVTAESPQKCAEQARTALSDGKAADTLQRLADQSHRG